MSGIRFSVIINFYNQRAFVKDAVDSILGQRRSSIEVIAVDDASTDGTQDALLEYGDAIHTVLFESNQGASAARNAGAKAARGEYLAYLDGDDAFLPWAIDVYDLAVREHRPVVMISEMRWFAGELPEPGPRPSEVRLIEYSDYLAKDRPWGVSASALVIERRALEKVGGWQHFPTDDHDLLFKLGVAGPAVQIMNPATTLHRSHAQQTVRQVPMILNGVSTLVRNERLGLYPGGKARRLERRACLGGIVYHWTGQVAAGGAWRSALRFRLRYWRYLAAAVVVRARSRVRGRSSPLTLPLAPSGVYVAPAPAERR